MKIAQGYKKKGDIIHVQADRDATEAVVRGVEMSDGEVVTLLMADDWLEPGALDAIGTALASDPRLEFVCGGARQWDHTGPDPVIEREVAAPDGETLALSRLLGVPYMAAFSVRRRAWEALRGFSCDFQYGADRDFLVRARMARMPAKGLFSTVYNYRRHEGSHTLVEHDDVVREFLGDHRLMASRWLKSSQLVAEDRRTIASWRRNETLALTERQIKNRNYGRVVRMLTSDLITQPSASLAIGKKLLQIMLSHFRRRGVH